MRVSLIVAMAEGNVIGRAGGLPWHLPADLKRFRRLTMGHHVLVGRRTWESIARPLAGRQILVVSRGGEAPVLPAGVQRAASLDEALATAAAAADDEAFVAGGAELYREALPRADRIYLTRVQAVVDGDAFFPPFAESDWLATERETSAADEHNAFSTTFTVLRRGG